MKPYTLDQAEADLTAACATGDPVAIAAAAEAVDKLDIKAPTPSILAAALWYAEQGLKVFPLQPRAKIPHPGTRGFKDATDDADVIRAWWERMPNSNLGLATGRMVDVVDIDGLLGQTSRAQRWEIFEPLHVIAKVTTPRAGGMHLYVPAAGVGNKAGLLPGIDYRGRGGYVVAPPSVTDDGVYQFITPPRLADLGQAAA